MALEILKTGTSGAEVGRHFAVHGSTNQSLGFRQTGSTSDGPRRGQRRVTISAHDRHIKTMRLRDRCRVPSVTAAEIIGRNRPRVLSSTQTAIQKKCCPYTVDTTVEKQMNAMSVSGMFLSFFFFTTNPPGSFASA